MQEELDKSDNVHDSADFHQFNDNKLLDWLSYHIPGFEGPFTASIFKGGQSNPTYKITTPSCVYVMRSKPGPSVNLLPSAHAIEREYRILSGLQNTKIPAPKALALCEDESIIGRAFYIMEFIPGRVLWDQSLPTFSSTDRRNIYLEMNQLVADLHSLKPDALGLSDFGKPGNYFERQIARWSKQYMASAIYSIPEMQKLIDWLPVNIPTSARNEGLSCIVHGDFRLDNIMFAQDSTRAVALLDWELSTLGHPLADFSYHCMSWHIPPGIFRGIAGLDIASLGIPSEEEYVALYCKTTGFYTPAELKSDWNFYLAYNMFRLAAILQGIAKRIQAGTAANSQASLSAAGAAPMARIAWDLAQRA